MLKCEFSLTCAGLCIQRAPYGIGVFSLLQKGIFNGKIQWFPSHQSSRMMAQHASCINYLYSSLSDTPHNRPKIKFWFTKLGLVIS